MRYKYIICIALAALTVMTGCRSARHTATTPPPAEVGAADEAMPEPMREVVGFSATVEGVGVSGQLRMVQDSALWLSVSKLIEVGRGLATADSVWISAPLMDVYFAGTYADLSRKAGRTITFAELQRMATSDNAETELSRLAAQLGFDATIRITSRRRVESLSLPFRKQ